MAAQTERRGRWAGWLNGAARPLAAQRGCGEAVGSSDGGGQRVEVKDGATIPRIPHRREHRDRLAVSALRIF